MTLSFGSPCGLSSNGWEIRRSRQLPAGVCLSTSLKASSTLRPIWKDRGPIEVAGQVLEPSESLQVMGLRFSVGATMVDMVGPLLARARDVC